MSHTDTLLYGRGTIPELIGLVHMDRAEQEYLRDTLNSFGPKGKKGFDFGIAALGIIARRRPAKIDPNTDEQKPFKFALDDEDGSFRGFLLGLNDFSARLNIEYDPSIAMTPAMDPQICADHIDGDLGLVNELIEPTKNDLLDLNLTYKPLKIAQFTVYCFFEDSARPFTREDQSELV